MHGSKVNAYDLLDLDIPRKNKKVPGTPFESRATKSSFTLEHSYAIIRTTLGVASRMKLAFETNTTKQSLKSKKKKFSDNIGIIRDNIVISVIILLKLGRD